MLHQLYCQRYQIGSFAKWRVRKRRLVVVRGATLAISKPNLRIYHKVDFYQEAKNIPSRVPPIKIPVALCVTNKSKNSANLFTKFNGIICFFLLAFLYLIKGRPFPLPHSTNFPLLHDLIND
jgi:hypothetical protein